MRASEIYAAIPPDLTVVIDLDDTVDTIVVPGSIVGAIRAKYPVAEQERILQFTALLTARLGAETAEPRLRGWLTGNPDFLRSIPDDVLLMLRHRPGDLGPLLGG